MKTLPLLIPFVLAVPAAAFQAPTFQNLGEQVPYGFSGGTALSETMVVFGVAEWARGVDLNGDGDATDTVAHVHDLISGQTRNLGHALQDTLPAIGDRFALFAVREQADGHDWNDDGDLLDNVAFVYDRSNGSVRNLHVAMRAFEAPAVGDGLLVFTLDEVAQGNVDANGDGVVSRCPYVVNTATGARTVLPFQAQAVGPIGSPQTSYALSGGRVYWTASTSRRLYCFDSATGTNSDLGWVVAGPPFTRGGIVIVTVSEAATAQDLNGDGDLLDSLLGVVPSAGGPLSLLPFAVVTFGALDVHVVVASRPEAGPPAIDWNGDGDTLDHVLFAYDERTGVVTNLGHSPITSSGSSSPVPLVDIEDRRVAYAFREAELGVDSNGDGDAHDLILQVRDLDAPSAVTVPIALANINDRSFHISRGLVGFVASESGQGVDLDGDGNMQGSIPHVFDPRQPLVPSVNLGLRLGDPQYFYFYRGRAVFSVLDPTVGPVLAVRGSTQNSTLNTNLAISEGWIFEERPFQGVRGHVIWTAREAPSGSDLTGDGDLDENEVLQVLNLGP